MKLLRGQPLALKLFASGYLTSATLVMVHTVLSPSVLLDSIALSVETDDPEAIFPFMVGLRFLIAATIVAAVYFRASSAAKWIAIVISVGRVWQIRDALTGLQTGNPHSIAWAVEVLLALVAVGCLFTPEARTWFARRGRTVADDRAVFE